MPKCYITTSRWIVTLYLESDIIYKLSSVWYAIIDSSWVLANYLCTSIILVPSLAVAWSEHCGTIYTCWFKYYKKWSSSNDAVEWTYYWTLIALNLTSFSPFLVLAICHCFLFPYLLVKVVALLIYLSLPFSDLFIMTSIPNKGQRRADCSGCWN